MTDAKELMERLLKMKPQCPFCSADVSYVYYGYGGERYCPNCMKELKGSKK